MSPMGERTSKIRARKIICDKLKYKESLIRVMVSGRYIVEFIYHKPMPNPKIYIITTLLVWDMLYAEVRCPDHIQMQPHK